ncbi:antisig_RsrA, mycothiol system anti-sigma-R factor [Candidatus Nanopelagicaceae bacterium]|jgi:predicted anti-sigma-YlaC factor YlaD
MSYIEIQCGEVLASVLFIIEGELQEIPQAKAIESHLDICPACAAEVEHERVMAQMLQNVLQRSCVEEAPQDLHESIHQRLLAQATGANSTEVITQMRMTEISIEIDEFGNIEHREIQIEQTHIQHFIDDEE